MSQKLARRHLSTTALVFMIIAASAPLTVLAGGVPTNFAVSGLLGVPLGYLTLGVILALFAAGAGQIETYDQCSWSVPGTGQFRPLDGARPALGSVGDLETVAEERIEVLAPRGRREAVLAALRAAHPYEVPAFDVLEMAELDSPRGLGRVGELPEPMTLREFTAHVAEALPKTEWGVRAAGDPDRVIRSVAVCGGSGDSYLAAVSRLGVDAYVTADLRHHPADEHLRAGGPALVDVAHWASEQPWCAQAREVLIAAFGDRLRVDVAQTRTDPWTVASG